MDTFIQYAPVIIVVIAFLIQHKIVVTPEQLAKARLEIMNEIEAKFLSLAAFQEFKDKITGVEQKIDKIYDLLIGGNNVR